MGLYKLSVKVLTTKELQVVGGGEKDFFLSANINY